MWRWLLQSPPPCCAVMRRVEGHVCKTGGMEAGAAAECVQLFYLYMFCKIVAHNFVSTSLVFRAGEHSMNVHQGQPKGTCTLEYVE